MSCRPCQIKLDAADRQERNSQVVDNCCNGGPQREASNSLRIQRDHNRVARQDRNGLSPTEPSRPSARDNISVGANDVNPLAVRLLRGAATQSDVFITRKSKPVDMGGRTLNLTKDGDFLRFLRHK